MGLAYRKPEQKIRTPNNTIVSVYYPCLPTSKIQNWTPAVATSNIVVHQCLCFRHRFKTYSTKKMPTKRGTELSIEKKTAYSE